MKLLHVKMAGLLIWRCS